MARAAPPPPITDSAYAVQLFRGPILTTNRITGLGGAYAGYAEGVDGADANAAAPAVREPFSTRWVDTDVTFSLLLPGFFAGTDFFNAGAQSALRTTEALYANLGAQLQIGAFGAALTTDVQTVRLTRPDGDVMLRMGRARALAGYGFFGGQLVLGLGLRAVGIQMEQAGRGTLLLTGSAAPEVGLLVRKDDEPWRLGLTVRAPVVANPTGGNTGVARAADLILPREVILPAELEAGFSLQVGPRPLNPRWPNPHEEQASERRELEAARGARQDANEAAVRLAPDPTQRRAQLDREEAALRAVEDARLDRSSDALLKTRRARYANWPRARVLLVTSLVVTPPVNGSVSIASFFDQRLAPYGSSWSLAPHFGVEGEPIQNRLTMRLGGYLEPNRAEGGEARQHFTFGADLKLWALPFGLGLRDTVWKLTASMDVAPRYSNWGLGVGVWH